MSALTGAAWWQPCSWGALERIARGQLCSQVQVHHWACSAHRYRQHRVGSAAWQRCLGADWGRLQTSVPACRTVPCCLPGVWSASVAKASWEPVVSSWPVPAGWPPSQRAGSSHRMGPFNAHTMVGVPHKLFQSLCCMHGIHISRLQLSQRWRHRAGEPDCHLLELCCCAACRVALQRPGAVREHSAAVGRAGNDQSSQQQKGLCQAVPHAGKHFA